MLGITLHLIYQIFKQNKRAMDDKIKINLSITLSAIWRLLLLESKQRR